MNISNTLSNTATSFSKPDGREGFSLGLRAAALGLLVLFVGRLYANVLTPIESVANWVIPRIPMAWFETGLDVLGGYAKPLLYGGFAGALLLVGALGGSAYLTASRRRPASRRAIGALTLLPAAALIVAWLLVADGGVFGLSALAWLVYALGVVGPVLVREGFSTTEVQSRSRRRFLERGLTTGATLLAVGGLGAVLIKLVERMSVTSVDVRTAGMPAPFTPVDEFYQVSKNLVNPQVDAASWRLTLSGMVERPYALTLPQLRALPPVNQDETLTCISNPVGGGLIGNAHWKGVSLSSLLERAGVQAGAVDVKLTCADGYTESFPIAKAMEPEVVLAYEMNGAPLTDSHGAPARLLVPNIYGMKNTKWLEKIEIVGTDYQGYWQRQGWSDTAIIQLISQVRVPGKADKIQAGSAVKVGGIAFAGSRGVAKVEWSADAGTTWREARLGEEVALNSWRFWEADWTPERSGPAVLTARVTDGKGAVQIAEESPTLPNGSTGFHLVPVNVT